MPDCYIIIDTNPEANKPSPEEVLRTVQEVFAAGGGWLDGIYFDVERTHRAHVFAGFRSDAELNDAIARLQSVFPPSGDWRQEEIKQVRATRVFTPHEWEQLQSG